MFGLEEIMENYMDYKISPPRNELQHHQIAAWVLMLEEHYIQQSEDKNFEEQNKIIKVPL